MKGFRFLKFKEEFLYRFVVLVVTINAIYFGQDFLSPYIKNNKKQNLVTKISPGVDRIVDTVTEEEEEVAIAASPSAAPDSTTEIRPEKKVEISDSSANQEMMQEALDQQEELIETAPVNNHRQKVKVSRSEVTEKINSNVYDYNKGHDEKLLSTSVMAAINRAMKTTVNSDKVTIGQASVVKNKKKIIASSPKIVDENKSVDPVISSLIKTPKTTSAANLGNTVFVTSIQARINKGLAVNKVYEVEFSPAYNRDEVVEDDDGVIAITNKIRGKFATIRGTLRSKDVVPMRVDLVVEGGDGTVDSEVVVPMFSEVEFNKFIDEQGDGVTGIGSALLVRMSDQVVEVEIDCKYEKRIYLDENLTETEDIEMVRYALFIGAKPGNTQIEYLTIESKIVKKIVGLVSDEIFYDAIEVSEGFMSSVELFELRPMANKEIPLDISEKDLQYVDQKVAFTKGSANLYEFPRPSIPYGYRNYFELNHLVAPIIVGFSDETVTTIPSGEFITKFFDSHGIDDLYDRCMVQINFPREESVLSVELEGEGDNGTLNLDAKYLDSNGFIANEISIDATNMTILSEFPGTISAKLTYLDGKVDIINTVCAKNSYLIEQLE